MCSQCSFQVVLRSLRFKQARHPHNARLVLTTGRRSFTTSSAPNATSSAVLIPRTKPISFRLPALNTILSQSYSIWNPRQAAPPPAPLPQEVLADNPFASHDDAAKLLYSLACHPYALSDISNVVCPTLAGLLSIRHYAGARAVLERVLQEIVKYPQHQLPFARKQLDKLMSTLLNIDERRRLSNPELHSPAAISSMLFLVLQYLIQYPSKFSLYHQNIKTMVCVPEYLTPGVMPAVLQLFERVVREQPQGPTLATNIPTLHNIMRVYALNGQTEAAHKWLNAILRLKAGRHVNNAVKSSSSEKHGEVRSSRMAGSVSSSKKSAATASERLATTYIMSLASIRDEEDRPMKDINSNEARKIFEELWQAGHQSEDGIQESIHSPSSKNLDIYAWSAMLQASSLDLHAVSSESLLDMLYNLRDNPSLPKPNTVLYTVVLGGLNRRGDYHLAKRLFEQEILPRAIRQAERAGSSVTDRNQIAEGVVFDCQLLAAVVHTLTGLGDINMACRMVEWFGQQRPSYKPVLEFEISDSQENHHSKASQSDSNALCHPFLPDILRGTVKVDTLLINQLMTHLAKMYRFNSVYNIFSSMTDVYNVYPDESTLAILAKTALTSAKVKKKGLIPDYAEDLWAIDGYNLARSQGNESFFTQSANRRNNGHSSQETGIIARETGVWDGRDPINRVMEMYWSMLEHNFDAAHSIALQDDMRVTSNGFFSFGGKRKVSPVQEEVNLDEGSEEAAADTALPVEQYHLTSALESTHSADDYTYAWPSLYPTKINMHMLVVLSGYLGRASDIPLIMSHMKVLHIKPRQSTLCLALWLYEESGVYATEMRKFRTWLGDWLGGAGVPSDETIGAFRARQWGGRKTL